MFERFTDRSRRVVVLAQEEARLLNHAYIGTEHLLLGLIRDGEGVAAKTLEALGISHEAVRAEVLQIVGPADPVAVTGHVPFTPRAKKVLELSLREALQLGHNDIGTEHLLLGLIREGEGVAAQVLVRLGADLSRVRHEIVQRLSGYTMSGPPSAPHVARHTPAGGTTSAEARRLAGAAPIGSQHYLLAAVSDESSLAARVLAALGVSRRQLEEALAQVDPAGSSDEVPEESGARHLHLQIQADSLRLDVHDPELVRVLRQVASAGSIPNSIRGGDALAATFPQLWRAVSETVHDIARRGGYEPEPD